MRASHLENFKLSQIDVDPVADVDAEKPHLHDGLVLSQEAPRPLTDLPGKETRPPPLTGVPATETNPQPVSYSTHMRSEYPPEEWLGSNHLQSNIPKDSSNALAILDTPPGDLRSRRAPEQSTPANSSHEHSAPLPPPTTPSPSDNLNTAPPATFPPPPPPPPLPPTPKVIEPMLSPFRPTVGGLAGFLQRASHANVPPPSSLTPTSSTQVLDDLKYNKKGEPNSYPAQDSDEDDLAYSIRLANWIPLNYDWPPPWTSSICFGTSGNLLSFRVLSATHHGAKKAVHAGRV